MALPLCIMTDAAASVIPVFVCGGRPVLCYADQYELLYNHSLALIFGYSCRFSVSFATHHNHAVQRTVAGRLNNVSFHWHTQ
jgi:hypothetical protein